MNAAAWLKTPATRVAFLAFIVAFVATAWVLSSVLRSGDLPSVPPVKIASLDMITHRAPRPLADIRAAVENDLFSPDRTAQGAPYRLPGEPDPGASKTSDPSRPVVLGTAVATDGQNFATVQLSGDTHPTLVHIGDKIGTWIVRAIERGKVTFVSTAGVRADVAAPKPGT
jgi:hypothetical protein